MKKGLHFIALLALMVLQVSAGNETPFKRHSFEISCTPGMSYHFFTNAKAQEYVKTQINYLYRPLAGFNFGVAYIYRPIRYAGISAGFQNTEDGYKMDNYYNINGWPSPFLPLHGYQYSGYIGVPVLLHGYIPLKKVELELATGPTFLFQVFTLPNYSWREDGLYVVVNQADYFSAEQIKINSALGWTIQLTADIPIKNLFTIIAGPEMQFLTLYPLKPGPDYSTLAHQIDYYVGGKIALRIGRYKNKDEKKLGAKLV